MILVRRAPLLLYLAWVASYPALGFVWDISHSRIPLGALLANVRAAGDSEARNVAFTEYRRFVIQDAQQRKADFYRQSPVNLYRWVYLGTLPIFPVFMLLQLTGVQLRLRFPRWLAALIPRKKDRRVHA